MGLKPIARGELVELISPVDTAIDRERTPKNVFAEYAAGLIDRRRDLVLLDDVEPVRFYLRAPSPMETRVMQRALIPAPPADLEMLTPEQSQLIQAKKAKLDELVTDPVQLRLHTLWLETVCTANLRVALVKVDGLEWDYRREDICGVWAWPLEAIGGLDDDTRNFLGAAAVSLGRLTPEKKSPSGS